MKCNVKEGRLAWSYKGEEVCLEACGAEGIRVRASFRAPINMGLDFNLDGGENVPIKISLISTEQVCVTKGIEEKREIVLKWPGKDLGGENFDAEKAIFQCGKTRAEVVHPGQITFFYDERIGWHHSGQKWLDWLSAAAFCYLVRGCAVYF